MVVAEVSSVVASAPTAVPQKEAIAESSTEYSADRPWTTIVWNDPINLMSYVTHVFMEVFGYPRPRAEKLMMDVHNLGRATVSTGTRERMEMDVNTCTDTACGRRCSRMPNR